MSAYADDVAGLAKQLEVLAQQAETEDVPVIATQLGELAQQAHVIAASLNGWQPEELDEGLPIDRTTAEGDELHVGERVHVVGSDRYGDPYAIVKGPGPHLGDGKLRVHVALENGEDDLYTPSIGRVHLASADAA
jgi:hypothetical protein